MRLIDADALKDWSEIVPLTEDGGIDINDFDEKLMSMPTVDAEPVRHGQWDYVTVVDEGFWRCSNCGTPSEALGARKLYKYCPFCGAKMDAEQEEQNGD